MSHPKNLHTERISEEARGDFSSIFTQKNEELFDFDLNLFSESLFTTDIDINGVCDINDLLVSAINPMELNEFDMYIEPSVHQESHFSHQDGNGRALIKEPNKLEKDTPTRTVSQSTPIPLSLSVGVGQPVITMENPYKIKIAFPLEEFYRARYKSDYVTHGGKMRRPRYVTDRNGNHCVTLKVPSGVRGMIRVDWLTIPNESGVRYSMPYRLQQDHKIPNAPDTNPIYVPIDIDKSGYMRLHLVLIKSKQDDLKSCQPLKAFQPFHDVFGKSEKNNSQSEFIKTPKQLIQAYHLEQSQLAFTFCTLSSDGKTITTQWDTTDYSTTLTETPAESTKKRKLTCPRCAHSFILSTNGDNCDSDQEIMDNSQNPEQTASKLQAKKPRNINRNGITDFS